MKRTGFIPKLLEALEIEETEGVTEQTLLTNLEGYDSLAVISIIALVDEKFGIRLSGMDFESITTIKSLIDLIGNENFK